MLPNLFTTNTNFLMDKKEKKVRDPKRKTLKDILGFGHKSSEEDDHPHTAFEITGPTNVVHEGHVGFDKKAGTFDVTYTNSIIDFNFIRREICLLNTNKSLIV